MRKTRVIGFAIAGILSVGTFAQAQSTTTRPSRQRDSTSWQGRAGRGRGGMLRGITLSDAEKSRVKAIRAKYGAETKSLREWLRPTMEDVRAARQKRDTAAAKAASEKTAGDRQKLQTLMQRERGEIRAALTPEHQQVFDANASALKQHRAEGRKKGKGERGVRPGGRGRRGISKS